ncbi:hypothetical protein M5K25_027019 [Dendrobium thyrsiflorum]|uniref:Uncharacterized protein n=1 Tax=Dendrobium thyrsiflorum TaxID=117978 RepID=A0ABD0TYX7_DENTH
MSELPSQQEGKVGEGARSTATKEEVGRASHRARAIRPQTAIRYCSSVSQRAVGSLQGCEQDFSELQRFTSLQDFALSGFRRSRVPVCELLQETLAQLLVSHSCCSVQVSGGAVYQFFGRSRMKMSTSSSGIVWFLLPYASCFDGLDEGIDVSDLNPSESLPRFTCSICDAKSGSDSSSSGKYRSSSELQSIGNTIIQDSGAAPLIYSSFTGVLDNTEMTRHTFVGRESASPFSSASPTLSSDIKSANLMGFEEPAWLRRCLEEDACTLGNPFRLSTGSSSWRPQSPIVPPELASYHLFFYHPGERKRTLLPGSHRLRGTGNILWSGLASNVVSFVTTLRSTPYSRDLRHSEIWRISMKALASRSVFPFAGTSRRRIPEPGVQSSELCIPELIGIRAPSSSEGELGPQVVGPRKISLAHQRSYFSLPTLGQQIYSGWEYWLQVPEQADLMGAQASSAEP